MENLNLKLSKENNLFKDEFGMLMDTIKNLQSQLSKSNNKQSVCSSSKFGEFSKDKVQVRKLKRKFEFLEEENKRLKDSVHVIKVESQRDFGKIMEVNKYYKMLNSELGGYVVELKRDLGKVLNTI